MNKLICFDMDGVIFEHKNLWLELHKRYGTLEEGLELTEKYVKTNYAKLVEEVVGRLWKGKSEEVFLDLINSVQYIEGASELFHFLKQEGYKIAIISSGPKRLAQRAQKDHKIDYIYTNELVFKDGVATGEFIWPIGNDSKAVVLRKLCEDHNIDFKDCIVVGHDHNDIKMARTAGFTIGFEPDDKEFIKYCNTIVDKKDLKEIIEIIKKINA